MLAIRMQRTGRSGHAQFRVIVQDSRFSPKSGRVVAYVGSYNPHTKAAMIDQEKINSYLSNGAMPSDRVAKILTKEGVKLPAWYKPAAAKKKEVRNPDKRRSTRPPEPAAEATPPSAELVSDAAAEPATEPAAEPATEEIQASQPEPEVPADQPAVEEPAGASTGEATDTPAEPQEPTEQ